MSTSHVTHNHDDLTVELHSGASAEDNAEAPPAVIVRHEGTGVQLMLGRSPIDGKVVLHIDGDIGLEGLARVFLNDGLVFGKETPDE